LIATILTIGIPTFTVLIGIFLNRSDYNRLDGRLTSEIGSLRTTLQTEIAAARKQAHDDIMLLIGIAREHEGRITRLESR
jgi:hypothetical protein